MKHRRAISKHKRRALKPGYDRRIYQVIKRKKAPTVSMKTHRGVFTDIRQNGLAVNPDTKVPGYKPGDKSVCEWATW